MRKKPDALLVLAFVFAVGVVVSSITHGGSHADFQQYASATGLAVHPADSIRN